MQKLEIIFKNYKSLFNNLSKGEKKIIMESCPCHNGKGVIFAQRKKNDLILNCSINANEQLKIKNYFSS